MSSMNKSIIEITDRAKAQIVKMIAGRGKPSAGVKISIKSGGCSGYSYKLEFADEIDKLDEIIEFDGTNVIIDPTAVMFIIGSKMDYEETLMGAGFKFENPNEKARCGCGESFTV